MGSNEYNLDGTIHAEVNAVNSLKYQFNKKVVNIIIIRTNKTATSLLCSKPCNNCIKTINKILEKKNYQLNKCYYVNYSGEIEYYKKSNFYIL